MQAKVGRGCDHGVLRATPERDQTKPGGAGRAGHGSSPAVGASRCGSIVRAALRPTKGTQHPRRTLPLPSARRSRTRSASIQFPKIEPYDGYLYVILHGIDFQASEHGFATRDIDFFLGPNYLVTVHDGGSRRDRADCERSASRNAHGCSAEGPVGAVAPHRRHDGRPLPAGDGGARGADRRARGEASSTRRDNLVAADSALQARRRRRCAGSCMPAARRRRPAGAARVSANLRRDGVPVPRRLRPPRPRRRRGDHLPGPRHRHPRSATWRSSRTG